VKFTVELFNIILPVLYAGVLYFYGLSFFRSTPSADRIKTPLLLITLLVHILYLIFRTILFNHPPITTPFEIMTLLAFCIAATYLYIELVSKVHGTGLFILILALFFQIISSLLIRDLTEVPAILKNNMLGFHVSSVLLGYTAITIGAMYGVLYLMLYHDIKSNHFSVIYKRLPNLETLESMSYRASLFGFILLSIAITFGIIWSNIAFGEIYFTDPKLVGSIFIWALYAIGLISKKTAGWHGRKVMMLYVSGFLVALFSITIVNIFFSSFHQFN
jgi:ABC-type transport system involved in cytochrome c biogenesis permease subunit